MWKDPIVEAVRKARQEHAAKFGYDLKAIYDDLKATEKLGSRKVVSLPPKRLTKKRESLSPQAPDSRGDKSTHHPPAADAG